MLVCDTMRDSMCTEPDECGAMRVAAKLPVVLDKASLWLMEVPVTLMLQFRQIVSPHVELESPVCINDHA
jgi:hypothetical protein